jgi:hypothetical protein
MRYTLPSILTVFALLCILQSCSDKDDMMNPPNDASFSGQFVSSAHPTSGTASINESQTTLSLTNFKTDTGPDLNMYLATDISSVTSDYVDLGDIKGVDGSYTYSLPVGTDFADYQYVVVWCVAFNVNFGYARLEAQ